MQIQHEIENHPLEPFIPSGARILMLGSFPPKHERWSMEFFYPNFQNDMWRIMGLIFHGDKSYFEVAGERRFDYEKVIGFCEEKGIAIFDTATSVRRLKDNASDKFLEVASPTDIGELLRKIPQCRAIATTGEKATETLAMSLGCSAPKVGGRTDISFENGNISFYRMPSSSRAYPLALTLKAEAYRTMFDEVLNEKP